MKQMKEAFLHEMTDACGPFPALVRRKMPLVHLLTNYVTVTDCVNAVLAAGAKAICSHASEEAAQVTAGADALVLNLGGTEYYDAMELSASAARTAGIPIVIDPVGCAASAYRKSRCLHLAEAYRPAAIRGNYAEIAALTDGISGEKESERTGSKGLDSTASLTDEEEMQLAAHMQEFARRYGTILIASGGTDLVADGERLIEIKAGTAALKRITGAGCLSTALLAAYLAAADSGENTARQAVLTEAVASAVRCVGIAGEYAQKACLETGTGAGHFHMYLMDFLSAADAVWE